ncbi:hypothetical protein [Wielerella bovis]|uniref:hypothetical protein n=1 Tax=Wielerella bovis TaxID=2917790 RepID=UPI002018FB27|nr:hypothetical protein [Wielerella bovis]MCG7655960.1 hypothetical protein [Wielerella bovis]
MSIARKDQLVYEALQDMDKYRQEQEVIFQRIREKKAKQPSVWERIRACVTVSLILTMKSDFSGCLKAIYPT